MSFARRARVLIDVDHPGLVWLLSVNHGFNEFFSIIIPPLFPFLVPELGIGYSEASLLVVVFFITYSVFQLPAGRLGDIYSPRLLLAAGQAGLSIGIALVAFAPTFALMLVGMVIAGIGGSTYHPIGMAVISDVESESTHGRSMGIHGMIGVLGPVASPLIMTAVAVMAGWRMALLAGAGVGLLFAVVLFITYPMAIPRASSEEFELDFMAALKQAFGGSTLSDSAARAWQFIRSPTMLGLIALYAVVGGEVRAIQTFTPVFASDIVGGDPAFGNTMLAVTMIAAGLAATGAGTLVDRMDRRVFAGICFSLTAIMVAVLVFVPMSRWMLPIAFVVTGVVLYSIYPATNAMAAGVSTPDQSSSLFAVIQTSAAIGGAGGPYILGTLADLTSLRLGFLTTSGIAILGIAVILVADETFAA